MRHLLVTFSLLLLASHLPAAEPLLTEPAAGGPRVSATRATPAVKAVAKVAPATVHLVITEKLGGRTSYGTGAIVHAAGYVVTANHVVEPASKIKALLSDGTQLEAAYVAGDQAGDVALLKLKTEKPLPVVTWGRSGDLALGETLLALGNSFGRGSTVTQGIFSAANATVELADGQKFTGLVQSDVSLHVGMSGGPLVNLDGEMVGLNLFVRSDQYDIAYALATDRIKPTVVKWLKDAK